MASKTNRRKASAPAAGGTTAPELAQRSRILIAFAVGGAWFMMFVKNVEILVDRADRGAVLRS